MSKKRFKFILITILNSWAFVGSAKCQEIVGPFDPNNVIQLYEHRDFQGGCKIYGPGTSVSYMEDRNPSIWGDFGFGCRGVCNDMISSIKVPYGYKVTVYEHRDFSGRSKEITSDCAYVGDDWNDIISSFVIEKTTPIAPQAPVCVGNGIVNFMNHSSKPLWFYYWYAEDYGNVVSSCEVRKLWKQLDPGDNIFNIPKNKTLCFKIMTDQNCTIYMNLKSEGAIFSCNVFNMIYSIND